MKIYNFKEIATSPLREDALNIMHAGIGSVHPFRILPRYISFKDSKLKVFGDEFDVSKGRIYVIGGGKASASMTQILEDIIPLEYISDGLINSNVILPTRKIEIHKAGHPFPDERGLIGVQRMLKMTNNLNEDDLVICLISGGGSALMPYPAEGVSLDDKMKITELLIRSPAAEYEIHTVRKHISGIKNGKLARLLQPARVITLILSDNLYGLRDVGGEPNSCDGSTFQMAYDILEKYSLLEKSPKSIVEYLEKGIRGEIQKDLSPDEEFFKKVHNYILADYRVALRTMKQRAESLGYYTRVLEGTITSDTKSAVEQISHIMNEGPGKMALIYSSDATINVSGNGQGGRNQEFAALMIDKINSLNNSVLLSIDSDGEDYIPGVGGAIIDNGTCKLLVEKNLNLDTFVSENDTCTLHRTLGTLVLMKPTYTNVGDLHIFLRDG
jgi:glycerate 2-kinase